MAYLNREIWNKQIPPVCNVKGNLGSHSFKDDCIVERTVTQFLIIDDTNPLAGSAEAHLMKKVND